MFELICALQQVPIAVDVNILFCDIQFLIYTCHTKLGIKSSQAHVLNWVGEVCTTFDLLNVASQFGPVAEAQQEGVLRIMQAPICFHTK